MKQLILFCCCLQLLACKRTFEAPLPDTTWDLFSSPAARPLNGAVRPRLEGNYTVTQGAALFGPSTVAKWSYVVNGRDTVYQLSFFFEEGVSYIICEGRRLDTSILLNGYWRQMTSTLTGRVRLTVSPSDGGEALLLQPGSIPDTLRMTGSYTGGGSTEEIPLQFLYRRSLRPAPAFEVLAHRGGGRTSDLLPADENSVEMIRQAASFGATGIEIDVQLTKDGVPVLYHDATLNERLIIKNGMIGPIRDYTFTQLEGLVQLKRGGKIPTLREALQTVVLQTPLRFVWLDTKYEGSMQVMRDLQVEFMQLAASLGRPLTIVIGLPDETAFNNFKLLNNYPNIPSLCELSAEKAAEVSADIWAPQWTLGLQNEEVQAQQAAGRRVFTWTMDIPFNINRYMTEGRFDGILSNFPSIVAYYTYAQP